MSRSLQLGEGVPHRVDQRSGQGTLSQPSQSRVRQVQRGVHPGQVACECIVSYQGPVTAVGDRVSGLRMCHPCLSPPLG